MVMPNLATTYKYKSELDALPPEERSALTERWKTYLTGLPERAYIGQLTKLTREFGPEFASSVISPTLEPESSPAKPLTEAEKQAQVAKIVPSEPWYSKALGWKIGNQQVFQPALEGLATVMKPLTWYQQNYLTPAAMAIAQPFSTKIQSSLAGQSPFQASVAQREKVWAESGIPWLAKTALELAVDPTTYIGFGLPALGKGLATKAGLPLVAKALTPLVRAESAYNKLAALPVKALGAGARKLPPIVPDIPGAFHDLLAKQPHLPYWGKPLSESSRSVAKNLPIRTANTLLNLSEAGNIPTINKSFSQILEDLKLGIIDPKIASTITNPKQKEIIGGLVKYKDKLGLDELVLNADINPSVTAGILGRRLIKASAKELGIESPRLLSGTLAAYEQYSQKLYGLWKQGVLFTPFYALQNVVENTIRNILVGTNPFSHISNYSKLPSLKQMPLEIQNLVAAISEDLGKPIPANVSKFAVTPELGGMTEAVIGGLSRGKLYLPTHLAALSDRAAIVRTFFQSKDQFYKNLMERTSQQTNTALKEIDAAFDVASKVSGTSGIRKDLLPSGWAIKVVPTITGVPLAETDWSSKTIRAVSDRIAKNIDAMNHEIAHVLITPHLSLVNYKAFLDDFERVGAFTNLDLVSGESAERLAEYIGNYLSGKDVPVAIVGMIAKYFPGITSGTSAIEPQLLDHLKTAAHGTIQDFIDAINTVQKTKHLAISTPITEAEKSLPEVIRQRIAKEIPVAWNKNNAAGISNVFSKVKDLMPLYIGEYQKAQLVTNLREFRNLLRGQLPKKYQPHLTRILNKVSAETQSDAKARLAAATSLSKYEQALFDIHLDARRTLESLAEENIIAELVANDIDPAILGHWLDTSDAINRTAFKSGDTLRENTFDVANTIRHAKDQAKIKSAWDGYIMQIQDLTPDLATTMRQSAPDNDLLWSTYRKVQEQRWFNVGQDKIRAAQDIAGIKISALPTTRDASGKILTMEDFIQSQKSAIDTWETRALGYFEKRHEEVTAKAPKLSAQRDSILNQLRESVVKTKESVALQERQIFNQSTDMAKDLVDSTFGNYASRTNLDEFMTGMGVPFWFFPSRSIPFYTTQMIQHPRLGLELLNMQKSRNESEQPSRMFGTIRIPGTNYYYNPLSATMLWQMANQRSFTPMATGGLEQGMEWMRNNLSVSLGPQWKIAATLVERVMAKQAGTTPVTGEPQPIIPQQRWLEAIGHKKLPVISPLAAFLNEPFDMYLRAVYGDNVAEWSQREVEKTIVDMGYNPRDAPKEIIEKAWDRYYTRQLLSIPGGAVKELTTTELARFEAINQKSKELGLTKVQQATLRETGESAFTGLRQDQLEALYQDIPAQKLWRYIRPSGLTAESKPIWEDYIQLKLAREELLYGKDQNNPTEGSRLYKERQYDLALESNQLSPREWKARYRTSYADYMSQVARLEKDYDKAPKTDSDWDAYRQMLGWDTPVRHTDDIKLDEYYNTMDSSNFETELGEFDFDAYRAAESRFFQNLSPDTISYIKSRKAKYKTPLRAAYTRDMEKVQPYYDIQKLILSQYPPYITEVLDQAFSSPDPAIQRAILIGYPEAIVAQRKIRMAKDQLRRQYPELDRIIRYWSS